MSKVFISHSHKDHPFAQKLAQDLDSRGVDVWYSQWNMKPGDSLVRKVAEGIISSGAMLVLLSRNSVESEWVEKELNLAMRNNLAKLGMRILPVLIEDCAFPRSFHFLGDTIYADFRLGYEAGLRQLLPALEIRPSKRGIKSYSGPIESIDATAPAALTILGWTGTEEFWEYNRLSDSVELHIKNYDSTTEFPILEIPLTKSESSKVRHMRRADAWGFYELSEPRGSFVGAVKIQFYSGEMEPSTLTWFLDKRRSCAVSRLFNNFVGEDIYEAFK